MESKSSEQDQLLDPVLYDLFRRMWATRIDPTYTDCGDILEAAGRAKTILIQNGVVKKTPEE